MKWLSGKIIIVICAVTGLLFLGESVSATSMEVLSFTGTVDRSDVGFGVEVGDTFSGYVSLLYDPLLEPVANNVYRMQYSYQVVFEDFSISEDSISFYSEISNGNDIDILSFWSCTAIASNGMYLEDFSMLFGASAGDALTGEGLPSSIDSTAFDYGRLNLLFGVDSVVGVFDTITVSSVPVPVPEPGTGFLLGIGGIGLYSWKQREK